MGLGGPIDCGALPGAADTTQPNGDEEDDDEAVDEPEEDDEGPTRTDAGFKQLFLARAGAPLDNDGAAAAGGCGICVGRFLSATILGGFRRDMPDEFLPQSLILKASFVRCRRHNQELISYCFATQTLQWDWQSRRWWSWLAMNTSVDICTGYVLHVVLGGTR